MNSQFRAEFEAPIRDALSDATAEYRRMLESYRAQRKDNYVRKERYNGFVEKFIEDTSNPLMRMDISTVNLPNYLDEDFDVKFYLKSLEERNEAIEAAAKHMARHGF